MQAQLQSLKVQHETTAAQRAEADQRLAELREHIDELQLRSSAELQSAFAHLENLHEQQKSTAAQGAETDQRLVELRAHIAEIQLRSSTELNSMQEQLRKIIDNPFVRLGRLMYRSLRSVYRLVFREKHCR